jgi:hypothetical protein
MIVTVQTHAPCRLFDADGVDLTPQRVVWADTETGEYVCYSLDEAGEFVRTQGEIRRESRQAPAPLSVVTARADR